MKKELSEHIGLRALRLTGLRYFYPQPVSQIEGNQQIFEYPFCLSRIAEIIHILSTSRKLRRYPKKRERAYARSLFFGLLPAFS
jgi:hypothetical protein